MLCVLRILITNSTFEYYIPIIDVPYYAVEETEHDKILDFG